MPLLPLLMLRDLVDPRDAGVRLWRLINAPRDGDGRPHLLAAQRDLQPACLGLSQAEFSKDGS